MSLPRDVQPLAVPPGEDPSTVAGVTDTEAGAITHASCDLLIVQ